MLIADVALQVGVKVSTIRFYLRAGLLPEPDRTAGGYRRFTADHVRRARFLHRGQELGFTLAELASLDVLSQQARAGGVAADLVAHGRAKIADIDARIRDLRRTRDALATLVDGPGFDPDANCPVVAALTDEPCDAPIAGRATG
ncbi:transcriptional regulator, MerR family [Cellulomonas flavigena DSM 20109]|uniref:Transcriptional regulator, MerR family n=1 Tax=Cellulomonas flavigena (strain ATCC 482 / DSM 20109 / BCRC 11376 / JCM 18109 / NBRC 3775 / NCIMB 8073 / NRS 134) TaxID=446466 RepID=D5UDF8_CELFN|nr:MerR family transcriptional regulator [Cellulomonas flavigena]ADG76414.1 transcriptional regulator, MerR family [Cellulomonas flavigena DSM 20109]